MKDQVARSFGAGYARRCDEEAEDVHSVPSRASQANSGFCPECGQPLSLVQAAPDQRSGVSWRSIFLILVGLALAVAFGLDAWQANQTLQNVTACARDGPVQDCRALPHDLALAIASGRVGAGDAFAARSAQLQVGRDARFAGLGLLASAVGLGAIVLRASRSRLRGRLVAGQLWLTAEGLVSLVYAQLILISAYHLVRDAAAGAPLSWDSLGADVDRTLSTFFVLVGVW